MRVSLADDHDGFFVVAIPDESVAADENQGLQPAAGTTRQGQRHRGGYVPQHQRGEGAAHLSTCDTDARTRKTLMVLATYEM